MSRVRPIEAAMMWREQKFSDKTSPAQNQNMALLSHEMNFASRNRYCATLGWFPVGNRWRMPNQVVQGRAAFWPYGILIDMSPGNKKLLERVAAWPQEDQEELAELAREIESRRSGVYQLSDDERDAVRVGLDAARHGEFAPQGEMEEFYRLHHGV